MKHLGVVLACAAALLVGRPVVAAEFDCMIEARQNVEIRSSVEAVIESVRVQVDAIARVVEAWRDLRTLRDPMRVGTWIAATVIVLPF